MKDSDLEIKFTGEFFVPGQSGDRIEADHVERYKFASKFAQGKTVLDIACGAGYSAPLFIEAGAISYDGVDLNEELVKYSNSTYGSDAINYYVGNICSFNNGKVYDIITCYETIEHIEQYEAAISNLHNLLNHGGTLLISSPNRPITSPRCSSLQCKPSNEFHTQEFISEELLLLLKKYNFSASQDDVFGQRQRKVFSNRFVKKLVRNIFGDPDTESSPELTPVKGGKVPRYFVIVATKK